MAKWRSNVAYSMLISGNVNTVISAIVSHHAKLMAVSWLALQPKAWRGQWRQYVNGWLARQAQPVMSMSSQLWLAGWRIGCG